MDIQEMGQVNDEHQKSPEQKVPRQANSRSLKKIVYTF